MNAFTEAAAEQVADLAMTIKDSLEPRFKGPFNQGPPGTEFNIDSQEWEYPTSKESLREGDDPNKMGVKFDNGKCRDDLIPPEVEEALATVLEFGARKYAERNWEQGMLWSRPYAAARRHLRNWFARRDYGKGPGNDKDSGYSDLWHACTNIAFLIAYEARGKGKDDRPSA